MSKTKIANTAFIIMFIVVMVALAMATPKFIGLEAEAVFGPDITHVVCPEFSK